MMTIPSLRLPQISLLQRSLPQDSALFRKITHSTLVPLQFQTLPLSNISPETLPPLPLLMKTLIQQLTPLNLPRAVPPCTLAVEVNKLNSSIIRPTLKTLPLLSD